MDATDDSDAAEMLSAVIIARDEADRIEDAIRSVAFADECVVLDSGSVDDTVARARALGARVVETDWPGHVAQKNRALAEARGDWILAIDADERVTDALRASIVAALLVPAADGFRMARRNHWLGHRLAHGLWYPDRRVRLARRDRARWGGEDPHDVLIVGGVVADLTGDLDHHPYRTLAEHLATIDRYSTIGARRGSWVDILVRPPWHFIHGYLLRRGFLDGLPGLVVAALGAVYTLLKWSRARL
ncbi:MAG: glycosyltransferase family 2 protein [Pseudomonadota bacterium]|nr:glycosyltransferase family 2 protein [Pseudomonadota bacterium]